MAAPILSKKVYTTIAEVESPAGGGIESATNINFMAIDDYDSTGTMYTTNGIHIPAVGTNYSYERVFRLKFTPNLTFNTISNILLWHDAGTWSDATIALYAGVADTYSTPVNTVSSVATTDFTAVDTDNKLTLDPTVPIPADTAGFSKYCYMQLHVPSTVTAFGDVGIQTFKIQYDVI